MGDMIHIDQSPQTLVQGCSFSHVGHGPFVMRLSDYSVVRSNLFHNPWGRNQVIWMSSRVLFENNIVTEALDSAYSATSAAKHLTNDGIYRYNRIYGNKYIPMVSGSYVYEALWAPAVDQPFHMTGTRIYNNVFADNLASAWWIWGICNTGNEFFNNIFCGNDPYGANVQLNIDPNPTEDNRFRNNIIYGTEPGQSTIAYYDHTWTTEEAMQKGPVHGRDRSWRVFEDNLDADPHFRNPGVKDFRIRDASPAFNAGRPLTHAVGAGSGSELPVIDARGFYNGFDIRGEQGDLIAVGSAINVARVQEIDLTYWGTNILQLDREIEWDDHAPVSLRWRGDAPNIGAWEDGPSQCRPVLAYADVAETAVGETVNFAAKLADPRAEQVVWEFGDGLSARGLAVSHSYDHPDHYPVRVRAEYRNRRSVRAMLLVTVRKPESAKPPLLSVTFEPETVLDWGYWLNTRRGNRYTQYEPVEGGPQGGYCAHVWATEDSSDLSCAVHPGEWSIEKYPYVRFAYRIPGGVPIGLLIRPFSGYGNDEVAGVVLRGTSNRETGVYKDIAWYTLIDDGEWHQITVDVRSIREVLPEIVHPRTFRFYTHRNAKEGQEYWFDNFMILPRGAVDSETGGD